MKNENKIRDAVRERYGKIALAASEVQNGCCTPTKNNQCCSSQEDFDLKSLKIGYSIEEVKHVPESSNLGLGCGNPQAIANLRAGEIVVDLGSGAGFDAFLAARQVGESGKVIGVDMTPAMISKARKNAEAIDFNNVEFRLGEIENLPVANAVADVIISNCVINLSPEKQKVFNEAHRVLKPGGRLAISDVVSLKELPENIKANMELYGACISGASSVNELTAMMNSAGFENISIKPKEESREIIKEWDSSEIFADYVISASIEAIKPKM
ncbi:MAG: arsenite methyltransferase [Draconibacterium sp.]